ncbi:hypothetical protein CBR_g38389 [Chara braunii]|uniref:Uncharacterized protein n=1 Tax=Chara braunii TaxID=69332 RepID=A0A388JNK8_CHABU|nr:hypothetical protein CBR_g38389 [Chara braunii]|eukprot:GBG59361.1 hypothetical protein CBR_g38389 [Chara braunii]
MTSAMSAARLVGCRLLGAHSSGLGFDPLASRDSHTRARLGSEVAACPLVSPNGHGHEVGIRRDVMGSSMASSSWLHRGERDGDNLGIRSRSSKRLTPFSPCTKIVGSASSTPIGRAGDEDVGDGSFASSPSSPPPSVSSTRMNAVPTSADALFAQPHAYSGPAKSFKRRRAPPSSEEEKQQLLEERRAELVAEINRTHEEHILLGAIKKELKFGKWLMGEQQYAKALLHFEIAMGKCEFKTGEHGEAAIGKATCLEKLGRLEEAKVLYKILTAHPFPAVKRKARQFLYGSSDLPGSNDLMSNPFYTLYMQSYGSYVVPENEKREETPKEKLMWQLLPVSLLLMGPLLAFWLMVRSVD